MRIRLTVPLGGSRTRVCRRCIARASALAWLAACAPAPPPVKSPVAPGASIREVFPYGAPECSVPRQPELTAAPRAIAPHERVPEFLIATEACQIFDSRALVGQQPFVVVFFASWCSACEREIPLVRDALRARAGQVVPVWVSLDDAADGWTETGAFLARHSLGRKSAVAGRDFSGFSLGYNPFRSVPVVVVVGRSGRLVAVQVGGRDGDEAVLEQALDEAIRQAPERVPAAPASRTSAPLDARPLTSVPRP